MEKIAKMDLALCQQRVDTAIDREKRGLTSDIASLAEMSKTPSSFAVMRLKSTLERRLAFLTRLQDEAKVAATAKALAEAKRQEQLAMRTADEVYQTLNVELDAMRRQYYMQMSRAAILEQKEQVWKNNFAARELTWTTRFLQEYKYEDIPRGPKRQEFAADLLDRFGVQGDAAVYPRFFEAAKAASPDVKAASPATESAAATASVAVGVGMPKIFLPAQMPPNFTALKGGRARPFRGPWMLPLHPARHPMRQPRPIHYHQPRPHPNTNTLPTLNWPTLNWRQW